MSIHDCYSLMNFSLIKSLGCLIIRFLRPTLQSLTFLNLVLKTMKVLQKSDQPTILYLLRQNRQPTLRWTLLPANLYPSGEVFFKQYQFYWHRNGSTNGSTNGSINASHIIMHNNYVKGYTNKLYRLKEMKLYPLDINQEYSNPHAQYIMFEKVAAGNEKTALEVMIEIANQLNRSLVLPRFQCPRSIALPECNLCGTDLPTCHRSTMKKALLPWKEHVCRSR